MNEPLSTTRLRRYRSPSPMARSGDPVGARDRDRLASRHTNAMQNTKLSHVDDVGPAQPGRRDDACPRRRARSSRAVLPSTASSAVADGMCSGARASALLTGSRAHRASRRPAPRRRRRRSARSAGAGAAAFSAETERADNTAELGEDDDAAPLEVVRHCASEDRPEEQRHHRHEPEEPDHRASNP